MSAKVIKSGAGITHVLADCRACDWFNDDYKKANAAARKHVADTGHTVVVEHAKSWTYRALNTGETV